MISDTNIERYPFFGQSDPTIAPCAPATYGCVNSPSNGALILMAAGTSDPQGKLYPGVLFCPGANGKAQPRPMLPNTGNVALSYTVTLDAATIANGNVLETDVLFIAGGLKFNGSLQRHLATGQIDIGGWTNTGIMAGPLTPNDPHAVEIVYQFTAKALEVISYSCDGIVRNVPLGPQIATPSNWLQSVNGSQGAAYLQFQLGQMPNGAPMLAEIADVALRYW